MFVMSEKKIVVLEKEEEIIMFDISILIDNCYNRALLFDEHSQQLLLASANFIFLFD